MERVHIYLYNFNKLAIITNLLAFFLFLFGNFSLLDPDPLESGTGSGTQTKNVVVTISTRGSAKPDRMQKISQLS